MQGQIRDNKVLEKIPEKIPEKIWECLMLGQVRFNKVPEKFPKKVPEKVGKLWYRARSDSIEFQRKLLEKILGNFGVISSQVQQVPKKV